jgi:hypothetical protein
MWCAAVTQPGGPSARSRPHHDFYRVFYIHSMSFPCDESCRQALFYPQSIPPRRCRRVSTRVGCPVVAYKGCRRVKL